MYLLARGRLYVRDRRRDIGESLIRAVAIP